MTSSVTLPLYERALEFGDRPAVLSDAGDGSYAELATASRRWATLLLDGASDLKEQRVGLVVEPGFNYVAAQWGIWLAGGIVVPLCLNHPEAELEHVLNDSRASQVVTDPGRVEALAPLSARCGARLLKTGSKLPSDVAPATPVGARRAMILYTSGTTARPKGVVVTHEQLQNQIQVLADAWQWSSSDRILHVLPLHHTHGIVNACACALWAGATCEMLPGFDAALVWRRFVESPLTLFMAVPTVYSYLLDYWEQQPTGTRQELATACSRFRLMVSGSAALPADVFDRWEEISGHRLLERYGMTEIGMALSNPLTGERRPSTVGVPLPGVEVRVVDDEGVPVQESTTTGELQVRGPSVFREYWRQPSLNETSFDGDWFRTGDIVTIDDGYFRILGRRSSDIIKSGGYKISALEIEAVLRQHPQIRDCSVIGVPDPEWGERVCAAVVLTPGASLTLEQLREWGRKQLARYKLPGVWRPVESLPRNAMGKVVKASVRTLFENTSSQGADKDDEAL